MKSQKLFGLDFKPISLKDQSILEPFFKIYPQKISSYTFATFIAWNPIYSYLWTFIDPNTLLIALKRNNEFHLAQPIGEFPKKSQAHLLEGLKTLDYPVKILDASDHFLKKNADFCVHFKDCNDSRRANYVYLSKDLATLTGKNYEKKRNLISQAEHLYQWETKPLTAECKPYCPKILASIGAKDEGLSQSLQDELVALEVIMTHFNQLKQKGCLIRIEGKPVAFSIFEELNPKTVKVHFEKAERKYKGLYQLINRETARMVLKEGYEFINREEDLGIEGLRKAKLSYYPTEIVPSHTLIMKKLRNHE